MSTELLAPPYMSCFVSTSERRLTILRVTSRTARGVPVSARSSDSAVLSSRPSDDSTSSLVGSPKKRSLRRWELGRRSTHSGMNGPNVGTRAIVSRIDARIESSGSPALSTPSSNVAKLPPKGSELTPLRTPMVPLKSP